MRSNATNQQHEIVSFVYTICCEMSYLDKHTKTMINSVTTRYVPLYFWGRSINYLYAYAYAYAYT